MAKRALIVGSQILGLRGPRVDAERMASTLQELGFEDVDVRVDAEVASRAGVLQGYRDLIERTQPGDTAVVYFSGHGARVLPSGGATATLPWDAPQPVQAIVPMDFESSTEDDFRGITDVELSVYLAELTRRTDNATVILDCCHAASMSREVEAVPKALLRTSYVDLTRHIERVVAEGLPTDLLAAAGNPLAVRLVAAGQSQSAYERPVGGVYVGTFTESLLLALREAKGQRVTWDAIGKRVRERVLGIHPGQRTDVEGPRRRYYFDTEEAPHTGAITIVPGARPREAVLRAGRLHGLRAGDEYAILPNGATADPAKRIAIATVTRVEVHEAAATLAFKPPHAALPAGAQAFPLMSAAPRRLVSLEAEPSAREAIAQAIERTGRFTVIEPAENAPAVLASVRLHGERLELLHANGVGVVPAMRHSADNLARLVVNLRMLAAAQGLRELGSEDEQLPESALEVTWGRVESGRPIELASAGEVLSIGTRIFVRVRNKHPRKQKLYVSIFDLGLAQRIQLLTHAWPAGYELEPGETFVLGQAPNGAVKGLELGWPEQLPPDEVRPEFLVVIATEHACNLTALETPGVTWSEKGNTRATGTPLQQLASQIQYGTTRDVSRRDPNDEGYLVRHIGFELSPWPVPPRSKNFLIDERPPASMQLSAPRGATTAPQRLAVRITELIVHDTRSWLGSSDIRLDTLVTTRLPRGSARPYRAETLRFKDVRDGERVPLQNALVYHGDASDFLDLRVWVSRDREQSKLLVELLDEQLDSGELQEAIGSLLTAASVSSAASIATAVGAAASFTAVAYRLLSAVSPKSIGLYQTSLLAGEGAGFGQGRHPPRGTFRAQGCSLGYEVVAVA